MPASLIRLLERRINLALDTKVVRHADPHGELRRLSEDDFRLYQSLQDRKVFECDQIIVFIGEGTTKGRLAGVYTVGRRGSGRDIPLPQKYEGWRSEYCYELSKVPGLDDLEGSVVIDWGNATRAWHQWLPDQDKMVLEAPQSLPRLADGGASLQAGPRLVRRRSPSAQRRPQEPLSEIADRGRFPLSHLTASQRGRLGHSQASTLCSNDEPGARGLLVRVGVDGEYGKWNAPVNPDNWSFVYVPIPEYADSQRAGMETTYQEFEGALHGWPEMPDRLARMNTHLDPDFRCLTYGDDERRGKEIARMKPGDFVVFYAGLRPTRPTRDNLVYALIGQMFVKEVVRVGDVSKERLHENAHTRCVAGTYSPSDVILCAHPERSGRYSRCISIGSRRSGNPRPEDPDRRPGPAYRVLPELLEIWGGLSVHDGWIERSATLPLFNRPERFVKWIEKQHVKLLHSNY